MRFTYQVAGESFSGEYSESDNSPEEAAQLLRSFRNGPLYVRYNPAKPADYFMDPYRDIIRGTIDEPDDRRVAK